MSDVEGIKRIHPARPQWLGDGFSELFTIAPPNGLRRYPPSSSELSKPRTISSLSMEICNFSEASKV